MKKQLVIQPTRPRKVYINFTWITYLEWTFWCIVCIGLIAAIIYTISLNFL